MRTTRPTTPAWSRIAVVAVLLLAWAATAPLSAATPAHASFGISQRTGWDACAIGSTANTQAWFNSSSYWNIGLYLGGSSYGTGCTRWTDAQFNDIINQGWDALPLWVGPQAPCTGFPSRFSLDPATAFEQGRSQALFAFDKISVLGWDVENAPLIYDLEGFDTTNAACLEAARQFISGWVQNLHNPPAQRAGVYGSVCGSALAQFAGIANVPDFIYGAHYSGNPNTAVMSCVGAGLWVNNQRHKQYLGPHNETWGGVTLNIDTNCSNGPVYPGPDRLDIGQGCV
jgi:hypothetical protein